MTLEYDFHRGWNGGWKWRATAPGKPPLEHALLCTPDGALLARPIPFPASWGARGVSDSSRTAWTVDGEELPVQL